ncbi:hypothetical protein TNCV_4919581 [Trichonephila clavipes]|nr:hypothetical protein TNCV_4919581 [Trichonephila clavipes]
MPRSIESETFAANHVCHSNFQGSALKMEDVGATRIFQRSIVKRIGVYSSVRLFVSYTNPHGHPFRSKFFRDFQYCFSGAKFLNKENFRKINNSLLPLLEINSVIHLGIDSKTLWKYSWGTADQTASTRYQSGSGVAAGSVIWVNRCTNMNHVFSIGERSGEQADE